MDLKEVNKMCDTCNQCFSEEERENLQLKGWTVGQISFAEGSVIENKIKELIR